MPRAAALQCTSKRSYRLAFASSASPLIAQLLAILFSVTQSKTITIDKNRKNEYSIGTALHTIGNSDSGRCIMTSCVATQSISCNSLEFL